MTVPMHEHFADLRVEPGTSDVPADDDRFGLVNVLAFGGAPDRHPHVPEEIGRVAGVSLSESTGADDALPFWHTNLLGDVYLLLLHGEVRVEFKEFEGDAHLGSYVGRSGDLMKMPKDVPHRTFSGNGRRRISLQLAPTDPHWESLDWVNDVPASEQLELDGLRIQPGPALTRVTLDGVQLQTDSSFLKRGARAIVAYGVYFGHNEFEKGFVISDVPGEEEHGVLVKVAGRVLPCSREETVSLLKGVITRLEEAGV
jgi:hypothetical protein